MNSFDEREKSFEKKFAHDQELQFKVSARRNKYIGQWASKILGYDEEKEKEYLPILAQGAAMRFLVTRIYDYLKQTDLDGAIFRTKDPMEYLKRLEFHNSVKNYEDYF